MCSQAVIELVQEVYQRGIKRGVIGKASADPVCPYCGHVDTTRSKDIVGDQPAADDFLQYVCAACGKVYKLYQTQRIEFSSQRIKIYTDDQPDGRRRQLEDADRVARAKRIIGKNKWRAQKSS